jgi:hypothetical protein
MGAALAEADMPACVHAVAALGHEEQTYFNCLASLVYVSTFADLACLTLHSHSEAAKTAFKENWENHKTYQLISLLGRVVARVLAIEFVIIETTKLLKDAGINLYMRVPNTSSESQGEDTVVFRYVRASYMFFQPHIVFSQGCETGLSTCGEGTVHSS